MGRAIVRDPAAFLMDEPLSNLDAKLRVQMRTEVSRLQKRLGTTTVYVTHDQTEAMTLGDRVAVMRGGVLQQVGSPQELYDHPVNLFVAGFIGSPAMNFMPAALEDGQLRTPLGDIAPDRPMRRALERAGARARRSSSACGPRTSRTPPWSRRQARARHHVRGHHRRGRVDGLGRVRLLRARGRARRPRAPSWRSWPPTRAGPTPAPTSDQVVARLDAGHPDRARARTPSSGSTPAPIHIFDPEHRRQPRRSTEPQPRQPKADGAAATELGTRRPAASWRRRRG